MPIDVVLAIAGRWRESQADLGDTAQRSGDIAERLHVKVQSIAPVRNGLIKKGMIYSPAHGDTAFTVPLFSGFMKRIMLAGSKAL